MSLKNIVTNVVLVLASSALTLAAVELALRLSGRVPWDTEIRAGWLYQGEDCCVNQLGFRGQAIAYSDQDIVVVLLGDSQVESTACPSDLMPEQALERHLRSRDPRYRVFTLGSGGYGNDQEYLALKEYFGAYRADTVVLWQTFENDVWNNIFPTHFPKDGWIKPTYWLDHGTLKGPNYQLGELVMPPARTKIGVLLNRWRNPQRDLDRTWEPHLPKPYQPLTHFDEKFVTDWDPDAPNQRIPYLESENLENEKTHFSVELYPRSQRMQYGLDLTRQLLGRINDLARDHHSRFSIFNAQDPSAQKVLAGNQEDDVVVHKRNGLFYQTRFSMTMANMAYANDSFNVFTVPIQIDDWMVSDTDSHLNCRAIDQVMADLAGKIADDLRTRGPGR